MIRQRVRIRFRKEGDLRLISHRDLVRVFERLFRRAELKLSMSEGFHPKARMSFPSALSLGIRGLDEVMEFELSEHWAAEALIERLRSVAPPGLGLQDLRMLESSEGKCQVEQFTYEFPLPTTRRPQVEAALARLESEPTCFIERPNRKEPVDIRASLVSVELDDETVRFRVQANRTATARPREILQALGLADLEQEGSYLSRTHVEITA